MKTTLHCFLIALISLIIISCTDDDFNVLDPSVDQFVRIVKRGSYSQEIGDQLPKFKVSDIGRLLQYAGDTSEIREYPANPISSRVTLPKRLNECIMWTVDGIRLKSKFPSLERCMVDTLDVSVETGYRRLTNEELIEVAQLFLNWHAAYMRQPSEQLLKESFLENTSYRWQ